jgi:hypothetical protein
MAPIYLAPFPINARCDKVVFNPIANDNAADNVKDITFYLGCLSRQGYDVSAALVVQGGKGNTITADNQSKRPGLALPHLGAKGFYHGGMLQIYCSSYRQIYTTN